MRSKVRESLRPGDSTTVSCSNGNGGALRGRRTREGWRGTTITRDPSLVSFLEFARKRARAHSLSVSTVCVSFCT